MDPIPPSGPCPPAATTVAALIEQAGTAWAHRCALLDAQDGRRYSFAQWRQAVSAMARRLYALSGEKRGARIALLGDATADFLFADHGIMCAGLVRVALDPALDTAELLAQLRDAGARTLLYCGHYAARIQDMRPELERLGIAAHPLDALAHAIPAGGAAHEPPPACMPDDVAALNYTGGTTGAPKAVVHTHASYSAVLRNIVAVRSPWTGDLMLNMRPLWPIAAVLQLAHLLQGGTLILGGNFEPVRFIELVERYRPTCTSLVPTHLVRILKHWPAGRPACSLTCIEVGAAAMPPALLQQAVDAFGPVFSVIYGLTEAPWSCYRPPGATAGVLADPEGTHGLVGAATPGATIVIGDGAAPLPAGEIGEVLIRGAHLMQGYWQRPELTASALRDGWFHTGDLGSLDCQGRLRILGRAKAVIRSGGKSVQPAEVEQVLSEHPDVLEAAVVGIADPEWGEIVAAAVVPRPGARLHGEALAAFCRTRLSSHKRPRHYLVMTALPRSHYGKVLTRKIQDAISADRSG
ncbi:Long-chain-fatty-acid--CoA ligase [Pigmentiphaga humi]|uniref:Long-chain-fatty-acid--CoA ligase n=1 Tax=Pigmentiphaga humi TaxID=2478468 RepID=A0A3P4AX21_9BURK|nr:AMP-binding protein [Pigmentiphaga humi]VCU68599.1 Long-chain-fatty-acid--CoA ligase [Pigmentiphaga humi]